MKINSVNNDYQSKNPAFQASLKITDPGKLLSKGIIDEYTQIAGKLGTKEDKIAINLGQHSCKMDDYNEFSIAVLRNNELHTFTDRISHWIYSPAESAEHGIIHLFGQISNFFK